MGNERNVRPGLRAHRMRNLNPCAAQGGRYSGPSQYSESVGRTQLITPYRLLGGERVN